MKNNFSGPVPLEYLQEKNPECPECGAESSIYISGTESQEFKCHGKGQHEFIVMTEDLLRKDRETDKEVEKE